MMALWYKIGVKNVIDNMGNMVLMQERTSRRFPAWLELSDRLLVGLMLAAMVFLAAYFSILPVLPSAWQTPGSLPLYLCGLIGAACLLVSIVFVMVKRTGRGGAPPAWFSAHVVSAIIGLTLVAIHSGGSLNRPPALMFLALIGLSVVGVWARTRVSSQMSATFGTRYRNFGVIDANRRARLRQIILEKQELLSQLDPGASEGTFSLMGMHWWRQPGLAFPYARLVREENRLIGGRRALPWVQAYWRWVHIVLGIVFVVGLASHVVTVTFFADYVAQRQKITWPHVSW